MASENHKPRKDVFTVLDRGEGKDDYWQNIGAAFSNKDGSLSVVLNALPINGRLQIRDHVEKEQAKA